MNDIKKEFRNNDFHIYGDKINCAFFNGKEIGQAKFLLEKILMIKIMKRIFQKKKTYIKQSKKKRGKPVDFQKIILITGANSGLDLSIIEGLWEKKSKLGIILTTRNNELGLSVFNSLCKIIQIRHNKRRFNKWNNRIFKAFKKIDYIVNNKWV